jgi:Rieske Fe-S protein
MRDRDEDRSDRAGAGGRCTRRRFLGKCSCVGGVLVLGLAAGSCADHGTPVTGDVDGGGGPLPDPTGGEFAIPADGEILVPPGVGLAISRVGDRVYAHSTRCTHEECAVERAGPPRNRFFDCPCHSARYAVDGTKLLDPAPRSLDRLGIELASDTTVRVDSGVLLREGEPGYDQLYVTLPATRS